MDDHLRILGFDSSVLDSNIAHNSLTVPEVTKQHFRKRAKLKEAQDTDGVESAVLFRKLDVAKDALIAHLQFLSDSEKLEPSAVARHGATQLPWLLVGPYAAAQSWEILHKHHVTHIVCVAAEGYPRNFEKDGAVQYLDMPIVEVECTISDGARMVAEVLDDVVRFVSDAFCPLVVSDSPLSDLNPTDNKVPSDLHTGGPQAAQGSSYDASRRRSTTILVHCLHGKTRSAAVAAVLKAVAEAKSFRESYEDMQKFREVMIPDEWIDVLEQEVRRLKEEEWGRTLQERIAYMRTD